MRKSHKKKSSDGATWSFMQAFVGVMVVVAFICLIFSWMYFPPKSTDAGILAILNQLTGTSGTMAGLVIGYYFGSSKGSADKDDAQKLSTQAAATTATTVAATAASTADALNKALSGTGNGNVDGDPRATTVKVTPPPPPNSVKVETKITKTADVKKTRSGRAKG